jgi:hypothetical protein
MKTIQQFYKERRYIDLAGKHYNEEAKWYNPEKVQGCEIDVTISDGYNTPVYRMVADEFLMELFRANAVDVKTLLENSSLPFAARILESIKSNEQQASKGLPMEGIPQDLLDKVVSSVHAGQNKV